MRRIIAFAFGWLVGPFQRGTPPPVGSRVRLATFMPLVPVGTLGKVILHVHPGRGVLVEWENGQKSVAFGAELEIVLAPVTTH